MLQSLDAASLPGSDERTIVDPQHIVRAALFPARRSKPGRLRVFVDAAPERTSWSALSGDRHLSFKRRVREEAVKLDAPRPQVLYHHLPNGMREIGGVPNYSCGRGPHVGPHEWHQVGA